MVPNFHTVGLYSVTAVFTLLCIQLCLICSCRFPSNYTSTFLHLSQPLADSLATFFTDKISKLRLSLSANSSAESPHSVPLPPHLLPSLPSGLLKSPGSCTTVPTSNQTLILFLPGFLNDVLLFSLPSSLILSIYFSAPEIFILLSENPLSLPSQKQRWIKKNSQTTVLCQTYQ